MATAAVIFCKTNSVANKQDFPMKLTAGFFIIMALVAAGGWMLISAKPSGGGVATIKNDIEPPEEQIFSQVDGLRESAVVLDRSLPASNDQAIKISAPPSAPAQATTFSQTSSGAAGLSRKARGTPSGPVMSAPQVAPVKQASSYSGPRASAGGQSLKTTGNTASSDILTQTTAGGDVETVIPAQASIPAVLASGASETSSNSASGTSGSSSAGPGASSDASATVADKIAEDFLNQATAGGSDSTTSLQVWEDATHLADERYRALKGNDAYLFYKLNAAKEALGLQ